MSDPRGTRAWRRLVAQVLREEPICWLDLPGCTRRATTGDHVIAVSIRPDLALVRSNVRPACKSCNRKRGNMPAHVARELYCSSGTFARGVNAKSVAAQQHTTRALGFFGAK